MRKIVVTGLIVFSALTLSWVGGASGQRVREVSAATTRTPTQVEVTNFPATQNVAGSVAVTNLPLDAAGNVRVSGGGSPGAPAATLIELRFHETDRTLGRLPLIPVPAGYRTVSIFVQTTDATKAAVNNWAAGFGSNTAPLVHYNIGDFQVFGSSSPLNTQFSYVPGDFSGLFNIVGPYLQLSVNATGFSVGSTAPPADTEYYVSLYLMP